MSKKSAITIILILVSLLILIFSFFDFMKYDSKKSQNTVSDISSFEDDIEIEENTTNNYNVNENKEIIDIEVLDDKEENVSSQNNINDTKKEETIIVEEEKTSKNEDKPKTNEKKSGNVIVIDPGHQRKGDNSKEPIGPGATETKAKVTTGATGVSTKQLESELNLSVSLLLQSELEKEGYTVIMTRTTQDVNLSNSQRAKIANDANADAFIRIHADSSTSATATGMTALCQTTKNKYNGNIAIESYNLSKLVLDNMVKETGARNRGVVRTDTMSGINWSTVPTTIIEMGFLSNPEEDNLLASSVYQKKIVKGIVNGINEFLK